MFVRPVAALCAELLIRCLKSTLGTLSTNTACNIEVLAGSFLIPVQFKCYRSVRSGLSEPCSTRSFILILTKICHELFLMWLASRF